MTVDADHITKMGTFEDNDKKYTDFRGIADLFWSPESIATSKYIYPWTLYFFKKMYFKNAINERIIVFDTSNAMQPDYTKPITVAKFNEIRITDFKGFFMQ